jgi:hypothetical protein
MKSEKFEFTVAGAELSDEQRSRISTRMNAAVLTAMFGDTPGPVKGPIWSNINIHGGMLLTGKLAGEIQAAADKALGG